MALPTPTLYPLYNASHHNTTCPKSPLFFWLLFGSKDEVQGSLSRHKAKASIRLKQKHIAVTYTCRERKIKYTQQWISTASICSVAHPICLRLSGLAPVANTLSPSVVKYIIQSWQSSVCPIFALSVTVRQTEQSEEWPQKTQNEVIYWAEPTHQ